MHSLFVSSIVIDPVLLCLERKAFQALGGVHRSIVGIQSFGHHRRISFSFVAAKLPVTRWFDHCGLVRRAFWVSYFRGLVFNVMPTFFHERW